MIRTTMMSAAFAIAALTAPAFAQTGTAGTMDSSGSQTSQNGSGSMTQGTGTTGTGTMGSGTTGGDMQSGAMSGGSMSTSDAAPMTKSQMASMKRCQAMPAAKMMKNKSCMKMQQAHPEMMNSGT